MIYCVGTFCDNFVVCPLEHAGIHHYTCPPPSSPLVIRQRFQPFVPFAPQRWDILKQPTIFPQDDSAAVTISVTNSSESGSSTNVSKPPTYSSATEHEAYENTAFEKEEEKTQF